MKVIEKYKKDLEYAIDNKEDRIVLNDGPEKARVFMELLFEKSSKSIEIYSHNLSAQVTDSSTFLKSFESVLKNKSITVDIVLNTSTDNQKIKLFFEKYIGSTNTYENTLSYIKDVKCIEELLDGEKHFTIIDSKLVRIETDINGFKAFSNFNDENLPKLLSLAFKSIKDSCIK